MTEQTHANTADPDPEDLGAVARSSIDENRYMTLATADEHGSPWASPVWYSPVEYLEFLWVSVPEARHSENLAVRPELAIVIFDSHEAGGWKALYMSAVAKQLPEPDIDDAIRIFSRHGEAQGLRAWMRADVLPPARHRLYRATVSEHFVLDPQDRRLPVRFA
jgi:nitroimidazol reductase NimA-like FMN-containing flavoprotein (pyridoxamine 5'-phosphate oxidase superfamily)